MDNDSQELRQEDVVVESDHLISIDDIVEDRRNVKAVLNNGKRLPIVYYPRKITPARMAKMQRLSEAIEDENEDGSDDVANAAGMMLADLLAAWDLGGPIVDENDREVIGRGQPVPIRAEVLKHVTSFVTGPVMTAMIEDIQVSPKSGGRQSRGR